MKLVIPRQASSAISAPANGTLCRLAHQLGQHGGAENPGVIKTRAVVADTAVKAVRGAFRFIGAHNPFAGGRRVSPIPATAH